MAVSKVEFGGETLIDLTGDSVTPNTMVKGTTAHNAAGEPIEGELDLDIYQTKEDTALQTPVQTVVGAINGLNTDITKLNAWYDENHYVNMTGTFTATNSGGTFEIGSSIESTFTWEFSKLPTTLTIGGVKQTTPTQEGTTAKQTFTASSQTSKSFTISGVYAGAYGNETASRTWTYNFRNKRYWGCKDAPETINSDFIKSLSSEFATAYGKTFNLNDSTKTKYIWYAYPKRFGTANFTMGGFAGGFEDAIIVPFTNGQGFTEDYYVYRSTNPGVGYLEVVVK